MSDILKVQTNPQFNWFNKRRHLDADGMPDKMIDEGLNQPDQIKVSFTFNRKDDTGIVVPDQARFGPECHLTFTLPDFESGILGQSPEDEQNNGNKVVHANGAMLPRCRSYSVDQRSSKSLQGGKQLSKG